MSKKFGYSVIEKRMSARGWKKSKGDRIIGKYKKKTVKVESAN